MFVFTAKHESQESSKMGGKTRKKLDVLAAILVVVGAGNCRLVAIARFDLVATIRDGWGSWASSAVVYGLVGLGGELPGRKLQSHQRRWHGEPSLQHSR